MFFIIGKSEEIIFKFSLNGVNNCLSFFVTYNNGKQKIANLPGDEDNESSKFATRKWYVINDRNKPDYDEGKENGTTIKFEIQVMK